MDIFFEKEKTFFDQGYDFVIGIDEAGRGPLAGPVVAAAVACKNFQFSIFNFQSNSNDQILNDQDLIKSIALIRDSKKLSEKQREKSFDFIQGHFFVGIGICDHLTIDRINILEATHLAMKKAVTELVRALPTLPSRLRDTSPEYRGGGRRILLVDGNKKIPNLSIEQEAIVSGDKFVKSISAASIIAKVTRDRMMVDAHAKFPQYEFLQHKGYGTALHMKYLKKFGPCALHRKSFRPVREAEDAYRMMFSNER